MDIKDQILELMAHAGKPLKSGEISELAGIDKKEIDKAMKLLKAEDKITSPKYCYWEPK